MNPYLKYVSSHFLTLGIELHLVRLGSGVLITVHTFAVINISLNPIKPNIGLWLSWEPSQESLKSLIILLAESYLLYMSIKRIWTWNVAQNWGPSRGPAKNLGGPWPTQAPLRTAIGNTKTKHNQLPAIIWNFYYDAKKLLQADDCIMITSN